MSVSDLKEEVLSLYHAWRGCCGVLLFLYSVILTKVKQLIFEFYSSLWSRCVICAIVVKFCDVYI